jgi:hypothetical protein
MPQSSDSIQHPQEFFLLSLRHGSFHIFRRLNVGGLVEMKKEKRERLGGVGGKAKTFRIAEEEDKKRNALPRYIHARLLNGIV